jgi:hypothetical protein
MNGYVSNVNLETLNTISSYPDTYTFAKPQMITEFLLMLGDGSTATVPCTEISHMEGTSVLAAALHHLIQRVAVLEALQTTKENL